MYHGGSSRNRNHGPEKERPKLNQMTVSVNRHPDAKNPRWNCQVPLYRATYGEPDEYENKIDWGDLSFDALADCVEQALEIEKLRNNDLQIVRCLYGSNALAHIYDDDSFRAAVMDHRYNYDRVLKLYVVDKNSESQLEHVCVKDFGADDILDIQNLPKHTAA